MPSARNEMKTIFTLVVKDFLSVLTWPFVVRFIKRLGRKFLFLNTKYICLCISDRLPINYFFFEIILWTIFRILICAHISLVVSRVLRRDVRFGSVKRPNLFRWHHNLGRVRVILIFMQCCSWMLILRDIRPLECEVILCILYKITHNFHNFIYFVSACST